VTALIVLPLLGVTNTLLVQVHALVSRIFSFTVVPSRFGLAPLALLLLIWSIKIFSFRSKKHFSYILIPLTAVMTYTLYTLSHRLQESSVLSLKRFALLFKRPAHASFKVVLLFWLETALFVLFTLPSDALDRYRAAKLEREERRRQALELKPSNKNRTNRKNRKSILVREAVKRKGTANETLMRKACHTGEKPVVKETVEEGDELGRQQSIFLPSPSSFLGQPFQTSSSFPSLWNGISSRLRRSK
jgi:S-DNA-T family DNA segregation ATPase FtsK/SpoIIIE